MKDYQSRRDKSIVLPTPVYHQCIWIVRDMDRLREVVNEDRVNRRFIVKEDSLEYGTDALRRTLSVSEAEFRLECIDRALALVPEELRQGILDSIINRGAGYPEIAHDNTWRLWKQRFIYNLARYMRLF